MGDPENCYPNGELCFALILFLHSLRRAGTYINKSLRSAQHLPLHNPHRVPAALLLGHPNHLAQRGTFTRKLPAGGERKGAVDASGVDARAFHGTVMLIALSSFKSQFLK